MKRYWIRETALWNELHINPTGCVEVVTHAEVVAVLEKCKALATHVVKFPYGLNANGCLEYRDDIKAEAQRLLKELEG